MKRFWPIPVFILLILPMILYTGRDRTFSTDIPIEEATTYPDAPSVRSSTYDTYGNRQLDIVQITGGNSFETDNTYSLPLSRNSLNAGLWEIFLFQNTDGQKQLFYQGWFTLPLFTDRIYPLN